MDNNDQIPEGANWKLQEWDLKRISELEKSGQIMDILVGCTISQAKFIMETVTKIFEDTVVPIHSPKEANDYAEELVRKFKSHLFHRQNDGRKIVNPFNKKN